MSEWNTAVPKKPYKGRYVELGKKAFMKAMRERDYRKAGRIGFLSVFVLPTPEEALKKIWRELQYINFIIKCILEGRDDRNNETNSIHT